MPPIRSTPIFAALSRDASASGEGWLVVDDLVDTGGTAKIIRPMLPKAHIATVYAKPAGEPLVDTYVTWVSQDTWIYFPWDIDFQPVEPATGDNN